MGRVKATAEPDLWYHYGRNRARHDRAVPSAFHWNWHQDAGPGPEVLGDLAGAVVGDLGSGAARHAAHLALHHRPARLRAVDASPGQHELATGLYGHLAPGLTLVPSDATAHLHATAGAYDVLYSVFGAVDFTDPHDLLPAAAGALKPGGRLVFSTLAHYLDGTPAQPDATGADIPARTPEGGDATMRRWVLQDHVWDEALDTAGFTGITIDTLPGRPDVPRSCDTLLVTAVRRHRR
jgi:SAM-dependent methyltransferase